MDKGTFSDVAVHFDYDDDDDDDDDLVFYNPFNNFSVISRRRKEVNERLCNETPYSHELNSASCGIRTPGPCDPKSGATRTPLLF